MVPTDPKIYHIVHVDNLASIVGEGALLPDSVIAKRQAGIVIGMGNIKQRRLTCLYTATPEHALATMYPSTSAPARSCST